MSRTIAIAGAPPILHLGAIGAIAAKEIRESLRNRWFVLYTAAFAILSISLAALSMAGTGTYGLAGFGRTAASLVNLVLLIVPLMGLTAGAGAIAGERERGTLAYLLAQPINRLEFLAGKFLGLAAALLASLAIGFGLSAICLGLRGGGDAAGFAGLVGMAAILALSMLSLGFCISALFRKASAATGVAIFLWLGLVFLGDLGVMGSAVAFKLEPDQLLAISLANPLQVFKLAALGSIHASLDVLGPAGLYAMRQFGDRLGLLLGGLLAAWVAWPLLVTALLLHLRRDV
jgi:Cu-processing system permease protein